MNTGIQVRGKTGTDLRTDVERETLAEIGTRRETSIRNKH